MRTWRSIGWKICPYYQTDHRPVHRSLRSTWRDFFENDCHRWAKIQTELPRGFFFHRKVLNHMVPFWQFPVNILKSVFAPLSATEIRDLITWCDALIVVYSEVDPSSLRLGLSFRKLNTFRIAKCLVERVEKCSGRDNPPLIFLVGNKNDVGSLIHEQACTDLRLITDYWISLSVMNCPADCSLVFLYKKSALLVMSFYSKQV